MTLNRSLKILLIIVSSTIVLALISAKITSIYLEKVISAKLAEVNCKIDSLEVRLISRSIRGKRFRWSTWSDSTHRLSSQIQIERVSIEGVGALRYLFFHELHISKITAEHGDVTYNGAVR